MEYQGQIQDGQMHGKGKLTYPNGETYEGEWVFGKRQGHGAYCYLDGGSYEGEPVAASASNAASVALRGDAAWPIRAQ